MSNSNTSLNKISKAKSVPAHCRTLPKTPSYSSIDYEQLGGGGGGMSVCSSRSESPLSENITGKCSSLVSLYMRNVSEQSDAVSDTVVVTGHCQVVHGSRLSAGEAAIVKSCSKGGKVRRRRKRRRSWETRKSNSDVAAASNDECCSGGANCVRGTAVQKADSLGGCKQKIHRTSGQVRSSSSDESIFFSNRYTYLELLLDCTV